MDANLIAIIGCAALFIAGIGLLYGSRNGPKPPPDQTVGDWLEACHALADDPPDDDRPIGGPITDLYGPENPDDDVILLKPGLPPPTFRWYEHEPSRN